MQDFFINPFIHRAKFLILILLIILSFKIIKAIIQKIVHIFKMKTDANYKKQYYKQLIKEAEHQHKKYMLEEAERYRKEKWQDPYNP